MSEHTVRNYLIRTLYLQSRGTGALCVQRDRGKHSSRKHQNILRVRLNAIGCTNIELLASFIVDSAGGAIICVRRPPDGGEALVIFSDKKRQAGPEYALPLLDLSEETVRNELELNQVGKQNLFG